MKVDKIESLNLTIQQVISDFINKGSSVKIKCC